MSGFAPSRFAILCLCCKCLVIPHDAAAQDHMAAVRQLYASASYEETLAVLDQIELPPGADAVEPAEYRILCLLALGEGERAQMAIEQLITTHPRYRPDPARFSPKVRTQFHTVRQRVLPQIVWGEYAEAKAAYDAKDYPNARVHFDSVVDLLTDAGTDPQLADLRTIATKFRDIAAAAAVPDPVGPPAGSVGTVGSIPEPAARGAPAPSSGLLADASMRDVAPPVPLKQAVPPVLREWWTTSTPVPGLFEIVIDERGRVESAVVRRSIHPQYDELLLRESRAWRYQPAMRNGKAVKFRKLIEIYSTTRTPSNRR
jgi:tetratricopeptide (TPR) repeat protein